MYRLNETRHFLSVAVLLMALLFNPLCAYATELTVVGTGDSQLLLQALADAFESHHPKVKVTIPPSIGSSGGVRAVASGADVIGRIARPLTKNEQQFNLSYHLFAYSPVVFIVNQSVAGIEGLTAQQALDIFSGKITNWSEVGGPEHKIYLVNREEGDSSRLVLDRQIEGFATIEKSPGPIFYSTPEAMNALADNPFTIGYGPISMVKGPSMRALRFNGYSADTTLTSDGTYPLQSPFALIWKGPLSAPGQRFVEFLSSQESADIMRTFGVQPAGN
jgi:phosphate transport system substrate-binding protein